MEHTNEHILSCAHCSGTGTCSQGGDGNSCAACVKSNELDKLWSIKKMVYKGLACGTCGGIGKTDTLTHRLNNRAQPVLAISILIGCYILILFFATIKSDHFSEILTFSGTLIGSVSGYYFGGKK